MSPLRTDGLRIGITQRRVPASAHAMERDALDAAWSGWFTDHWPAANFLTIPNFPRPELALRHVQDWGVNALVLSGGEDIGSSPARDAVESALLDYACQHRLPVLGVCRGMQLLHTQAGGVLTPQPGHVGTPHRVSCGQQAMTVNSWHRFGITSLQPGWHALAVSENGGIEAMQHASLPWLGLMWHPERAQGNPAPMWRWIAAMFASS